MVDEITEYCHVLLGRVEPPAQSPYLQLAEIAAAYHARGREIEMLIYLGEQNGSIVRGDRYYKFRTGPLNSFLEMSKRLYDLGSRRLSQEIQISRERIDIGEVHP